MIIDINSFNIYLLLILNGIFTGLGVAIGTYFAQSHIIKKGEALVKHIRKNYKK